MLLALQECRADAAYGLDQEDVVFHGVADRFVEPVNSAERGDVIVAVGSWVTYLRDNQYYEIHPVHAWYLVCRGGQLFEKGTISSEACRFDTGRIKTSDYDIICRMAHAAEVVQPPQTNTTTYEGALAMGSGLH